MNSAATIYGVGLGPGDPELMSVKAARLIAKAGVIAHFRKPGRPGNARTLVDGLLAPGVIEEALEYPVTTEIALGKIRPLPKSCGSSTTIAFGACCSMSPMAAKSRCCARATRSYTAHSCICTAALPAARLSWWCPAFPACPAAGPPAACRSRWRRCPDGGAGNARRGKLARAAATGRRACRDEARPQSSERCVARWKPPVSPSARHLCRARHHDRRRYCDSLTRPTTRRPTSR